MNFCSKRFISAMVVVAVGLLLPTTTFAAAPDGLGPWADTVFSTNQGLTKGGGAVPAIRSNSSSALGVAENNTTDGNFYSLGFGGSITLGFDNGISSGVIVVEATNPGYPSEKAKVEVSEDGVTFVNAGTITQDGQVNKPDGITCARYVRITDASNPDDFSEATADAFDVDGAQAQGDPCTPPSNGDGHGGDCIISQTNETKVNTTVNATANSGNNTANDNTGGNVAITTNPASNTVDVSVTGGTNTATDCGCCCGDKGTTTAVIAGNGEGSTNTIKIGSKTKKAVKPVVLKTAKKKIK